MQLVLDRNARALKDGERSGNKEVAGLTLKFVKYRKIERKTITRRLAK